LTKAPRFVNIVRCIFIAEQPTKRSVININIIRQSIKKSI